MCCLGPPLHPLHPTLTLVACSPSPFLFISPSLLSSAAQCHPPLLATSRSQSWPVHIICVHFLALSGTSFILQIRKLLNLSQLIIFFRKSSFLRLSASLSTSILQFTCVLELHCWFHFLTLSSRLCMPACGRLQHSTTTKLTSCALPSCTLLAYAYLATPTACQFCIFGTSLSSTHYFQNRGGSTTPFDHQRRLLLSEARPSVPGPT